MLVEVWSDIVCPWCYIGKRRLERAIEAFPARDGVEVRFRSFELDPGRERRTDETPRPDAGRQVRREHRAGARHERPRDSPGRGGGHPLPPRHRTTRQHLRCPPTQPSRAAPGPGGRAGRAAPGRLLLRGCRHRRPGGPGRARSRGRARGGHGPRRRSPPTRTPRTFARTRRSRAVSASGACRSSSSTVGWACPGPRRHRSSWVPSSKQPWKPAGRQSPRADAERVPDPAPHRTRAYPAGPQRPVAVRYGVGGTAGR